MKAEKNIDGNEDKERERLTQRFAGASTTHLSAGVAERIDLFNISKKTELASLPKDSVLEIQVSDRPPINFYRDSEGNFDLLSDDVDGVVQRVPVKVIGSSVAPDAFYDAGSLTQSGYFQYGIRHQFKTGQEEGVPELFRLFDDPDKLDPAILQANLDNGIVVHGEDGSLMWSVVDQRPPIGPVVSAIVMHGKGMEQVL